MIGREPRLTVGWATKIINVYLKTRVYIGALGRHHLKEMIVEDRIEADQIVKAAFHRLEGCQRCRGKTSLRSSLARPEQQHLFTSA
jgi:hypothetical protein